MKCVLSQGFPKVAQDTSQQLTFPYSTVRKEFSRDSERQRLGPVLHLHPQVFYLQQALV